MDSSAVSVRQLKLNVSQVVILWAVISGSMVAVFMFGLFTGKEQGLRQALEAQEQLAMRFPLVDGAPVSGDQPASLIGSAIDGDRPATAELVPVSNPAPDSEPSASKTVIAKNEATSEPSLAAKPAEPVKLARGANNGDSPTLASKDNSARARLNEEHDAVAPPAPTSVVAPATVVTPAPAKLAPKQKDTKDTAISPKTHLPNGWYVQVAAAKNMNEANSYAAKLKKIGIKPQIEDATVKNVRYLRVMVGPYSTENGAIGAQKKIRDAKISPNIPFTKRIS